MADCMTVPSQIPVSFGGLYLPWRVEQLRCRCVRGDAALLERVTNRRCPHTQHLPSRTAHRHRELHERLRFTVHKAQQGESHEIPPTESNQGVSFMLSPFDLPALLAACRCPLRTTDRKAKAENESPMRQRAMLGVASKSQCMSAPADDDSAYLYSLSVKTQQP